MRRSWILIALLSLTQPDGRAIWVNPKELVAVLDVEPDSGICYRGAHTLVVMTDDKFCVQEDPELLAGFIANVIPPTKGDPYDPTRPRRDQVHEH